MHLVHKNNDVKILFEYFTQDILYDAYILHVQQVCISFFKPEDYFEFLFLLFLNDFKIYIDLFIRKNLNGYRRLILP